MIWIEKNNKRNYLWFQLVEAAGCQVGMDSLAEFGTLTHRKYIISFRKQLDLMPNTEKQCSPYKNNDNSNQDR